MSFNVFYIGTMATHHLLAMHHLVTFVACLIRFVIGLWGYLETCKLLIRRRMATIENTDLHESTAIKTNNWRSLSGLGIAVEPTILLRAVELFFFEFWGQNIIKIVREQVVAASVSMASLSSLRTAGRHKSSNLGSWRVVGIDPGKQ